MSEDGDSKSGPREAARTLRTPPWLWTELIPKAGKAQAALLWRKEKKNSNSTQDEDCKGIPAPMEEGLVPGNSRDTYPLPSPIPDRNRPRQEIDPGSHLLFDPDLLTALPSPSPQLRNMEQGTRQLIVESDQQLPLRARKQNFLTPDVLFPPLWPAQHDLEDEGPPPPTGRLHGRICLLLNVVNCPVVYHKSD
ncbi:hypothetical protein MJT46_018708 [Ovis ammon polii x Ovis aries]|nr:hypothetical protein MJT46_018708 [Ovis ammon polii x Ovis aries]